MKYRPEYDLKVIGKNLKRLREAKKLSVEEVRQYLRLGTTQAVYKYESGNGYPQADTLLALMELYEADLHDIVDEHNDVDLCSSQTESVSEVIKKPVKETCLEDAVVEIRDYFMMSEEQELLLNIIRTGSRHREEQKKRLQKYYDYYMQYCNKAG